MKAIQRPVKIKIWSPQVIAMPVTEVHQYLYTVEGNFKFQVVRLNYFCKQIERRSAQMQTFSHTDRIAISNVGDTTSPETFAYKDITLLLQVQLSKPIIRNEHPSL